MLKKSLMALALVGAAAVAQAATVTFGGVDAGEVDTLLGEADELPATCGNGGNPVNELCWINSVVEPNTTYGDKQGNVSILESDAVGDDVVGFELWAPTEYFMVKNATNWAIFKNNGNLNWAVFSLGDLTLKQWNIEAGKTISHGATIGGTPSEVPVPGTLGLLGLGLAGLGAIRRRKA